MRAPIQFPWTPDLKAEVVKRFLDGESAAEIARKIAPQIKQRPSRSAVIGLINRQGIRHKDRRASYPAHANRTPLYTPPTCMPRTAAPRPAPAPKPQPVAKAKPAPKPVLAKPHVIIGGNGTVMGVHEDRHPSAPPPRAKAFDALPGTNPLPFDQRPAHGCKWPINRPDDTDGLSRLSCCAPRDGDHQYCPMHHDLSISGKGGGEIRAPRDDSMRPARTAGPIAANRFNGWAA